QARTYKDYGLNDKTDPGRRLFFPQDDNALDLYLQVLQVDPQNAEAQQGLSEIAGWVYDRAFRLCHEMNRWVACRLLAENGLRAEPSHEGLRELVDDAQRGERGETVAPRAKR
ncbi:MAG TPA: hypothetical protein VFY12_12090, partial [Arenimonas sp.]|nr:hypothetical protein [Arenimonas sp.]